MEKSALMKNVNYSWTGKGINNVLFGGWVSRQLKGV
jgi:hypothetical protein